MSHVTAVMDPNPYEPPEGPSTDDPPTRLNLRRSARRKVGSFREWLGQFAILVALMLLGGAIGWPLGFFVEGAMIGIGVFTALMIIRR